MVETSDPPRPRALLIARGAAATVHGPLHEAHVHSVFQRAANLWAPPDRLLALTAPTAMRVPNGVVVEAPAGPQEPEFLRLAVGMAVSIGDGFIRFSEAALALDLADVPLWDPRPRFPGRPIPPTLLGQRLDRLDVLIRERARAHPWSFASILDPTTPSGESARRGAASSAPTHDCPQQAKLPFLGTTIEPIVEARLQHLTRRTLPAANALLAGIATADIDIVSSAAQGLAGLGHGLTPSGDDFLIGVCGALTLAESVLPAKEETPQAAPGHELAGAIAAATEGRTTLLSAVWLNHAARGEFSAEVGDVLVALADAEAILDAAVARLLAIGGLSGLDTAMGVLLGSRTLLAAWQGA